MDRLSASSARSLEPWIASTLEELLGFHMDTVVRDTLDGLMAGLTYTAFKSTLVCGVVRRRILSGRGEMSRRTTPMTRTSDVSLILSCYVQFSYINYSIDAVMLLTLSFCVSSCTDETILQANW